MDFLFIRLLQPYAWRQCFSFSPIFFGVLLIIMHWTIYSIPASADLNVSWVLYFGYMIWIAVIISSVCRPEDTFVLDGGDAVVCTYKEKGKYLIVCTKINGPSPNKETFYAKEYLKLFQNSEISYFAYRPTDENDWYCWRRYGDIKKLGAKLNKMLFLYSDKGTAIINILSYIDVIELKSEYVKYNTMCIPQGSQVCYTDGRKISSKPDDLLLIQSDGKYKTYGFYLSTKIPYYREIIVSSIIFRKGCDKVLLWWNPETKQYVERYSFREMFGLLNDFFVEMTEDYKVGGNIYRYDGETETMRKLYEGNFRIIDFDLGTILGDNGRYYGARQI